MQHRLREFEAADHSSGICFHQSIGGAAQPHEIQSLVDAR